MDEILNLIESVSEGFPSYFSINVEYLNKYITWAPFVTRWVRLIIEMIQVLCEFHDSFIYKNSGIQNITQLSTPHLRL